MDKLLKEKIAGEISDLYRLYNDWKDYINNNSKEPDNIIKTAFGGFLHSFYNGIENIFTIIAKKIDKSLPQGESYHIDLLNQMCMKNEKRSEVIDIDLKDVLDEYRRFRHVFRNVYSFELNWNKMKPLVSNVKEVLDSFTINIFYFLYKDQISLLYDNVISKNKIQNDFYNNILSFTNDEQGDFYLLLLENDVKKCIRLKDDIIFNNDNFLFLEDEDEAEDEL